MKNSELKSDEQLWKEASNGDVNAEGQLIQRYSRIVKVCARPLFLMGGDSEDLIQEGMLGLLSAVRQYDPSKETSFKTYAELCVKNRIYTAIKSAARMKHTPLNDYVSFQSPHFDESRTLSNGYARDPEELIITKERLDEITNNTLGCLSKLESQVLSLYLDGLSYDEISKALNKTPKSVDNAVQRIRRKLAQYN